MFEYGQLSIGAHPLVLESIIAHQSEDGDELIMDGRMAQLFTSSNSSGGGGTSKSGGGGGSKKSNGTTNGDHHQRENGDHEPVKFQSKVNLSKIFYFICCIKYQEFT